MWEVCLRVCVYCSTRVWMCLCGRENESFRKPPEPWAHAGFVCAQPEAPVLGCAASHAGPGYGWGLGLSGREWEEVWTGLVSQPAVKPPTGEPTAAFQEDRGEKYTCVGGAEESAA